VQDYVAEGLSVLAGAPKLGKSWWALNVAVAVAANEPAFGSVRCEAGDVLYLALEDNQRRLQSRLRFMGCDTPPERLTFCTQWPTLADGAVKQIADWADNVARPTLVIVDVLAKVRDASNGRDSAYDTDYRTLTGLQELAGQRNIAIVALHHTRKLDADDPFDSVSGTRGLTGAADTVLVLKKDHATGRTILYGRGRDIAEIETAFELDGEHGTWRVLGEPRRVAKTIEQQEIQNLLEDVGEPMKLAEIAEALGKSKPNVSKMLCKMVEQGIVTKTATGSYASVKTVNPVDETASELTAFTELTACPSCDGQGCGWCGGGSLSKFNTVGPLGIRI
jgi:biotin operon repressor